MDPDGPIHNSGVHQRVPHAPEPGEGDPPTDGTDGRFSFSYKDEAAGESVDYQVQNVGGGMALCTVAGMIPSMAGVGGGMVKVPLMNIYMHVPIKAASATSSYMIGITAFSGGCNIFPWRTDPS